jgi:transposase
MPEKKKVVLSTAQREKLLRIIRTGKRSSRAVLRARILIKSASGWTDEQIAQALETSRTTVRRTRLRRRAKGVVKALAEEPRTGAPHKLTVEEEARVIALACSTPPTGHCRWTVRLLAQTAVERKLIPPVVPETVRAVLKKTRSNLGNFRAGVMSSLPQPF